MIILEIVQGQILFINEKTGKRELARNKMEISTAEQYHFSFKSEEKSSANIIINGHKIHMGPSSELHFCNIEGKIKTHHKLSGARLLFGTVWSKVTQIIGKEDNDWNNQYNTGNDAPGVRG